VQESTVLEAGCRIKTADWCLKEEEPEEERSFRFRMKDSLRFKKHNRLSKSSDFKKLYLNGIRISGYFYTAFFIPNGLEYSRIGISVSRKIGKAVVRNREKRIIREVFRKLKGNRRFSFDIVIVVKNSPSGFNSRARSKEIIRIFNWLGSFCIA
jgi:ribonuclease P protein component